MAIQTVDLTVPGGDTPRSANTKLNANFTNPAHAASRLVGGAAGNLMEVSAFGLGATFEGVTDMTPITVNTAQTQFSAWYETWNVVHFKNYLPASPSLPNWTQMMVNRNGAARAFKVRSAYNGEVTEYDLYGTHNVNKDSNGFLKGASPVVDLYDEKIDLNYDAKAQGGITFEKLGVGDYLIKGSLGFAQEGWYIEMPKDANGNVLVAVVYKQLGNNDLSIKTYAKRFDDETGDIVANLLKPRDIPAGRFISLRLHELPKEPPVMPTQDTSANAPAQTNNP